MLQSKLECLFVMTSNSLVSICEIGLRALGIIICSTTEDKLLASEKHYCLNCKSINKGSFTHPISWSNFQSNAIWAGIIMSTGQWAAKLNLDGTL